jgi:microcystin-dependent protein
MATTAFVQYAAPAGAVTMFARATAPTGWLKANGALISRVTYATLFTAIGTTFGVGDGSTTFALPDLRGEFLRAFDDARGVDASRVFGSAQAQGTLSHTHTFTGIALATHDHGLTVGVNSVAHSHSFADSSSATGTGSANHVHNMPSRVPNIVTGTGFGLGAGVTFTDNKDTDVSGAAHTHTVAVSGTTGNNSANHVHTVDITAISAGTPAGTIAAQTGGLTETRPRNLALLCCIKY